MNIRVLVVEDNENLNELIVNVLQKEKYVSFGERSIETAKKTYMLKKPHIVLLDIMLPGGKGYELISYFRIHGVCRIIMITALNDFHSKMVCYEKGADDYVIKPFDLAELVYKINAIKRWIELEIYNIGDISFDKKKSTLTGKCNIIMLPPTQAKMFNLLCDKHLQNTYVNKVEVFRSNLDESHRLQMVIARLRSNLQFVGSDKVFIETIRGKGYQLQVYG
ncbi:response regulator transcription factor [Clostridiaceae bacterium M8S5]|nr:response regulator transcription factor [Clostridiaceae bacterium M8S5]